MNTRTLVVVRHAQAESFASGDHARRLTDAGTADARALGAGLVHEGLVPDAVLVSDAVRTRETWQAMQEGARDAGAEWRPTEEITRAAYNAEVDVLLQLIRESPAAARCVVVIGHNPTVASTALLLEDGDGDATAAAEMAHGHPTAARAVFTVPGDWADLDFGGASLRSFVVARAGD